MKQWEYKVEIVPHTLTTTEELVDWLDNQGYLGWELILNGDDHEGIHFIFKREKSS